MANMASSAGPGSLHLWAEFGQCGGLRRVGRKPDGGRTEQGVGGGREGSYSFFEIKEQVSFDF